MRVCQAKSMKIHVIRQVRLALDPHEFLGPLLVSPVKVKILQRERRLLRNHCRPLGFDSHIGNRFDNAPGQELIWRDLKILVGIGKRYCRNQQ